MWTRTLSWTCRRPSFSRVKIATTYCSWFLDKNFFWHGILSLNELGAHAFFDVKIKKNVPEAPNMVGLLTIDIPAANVGNEKSILCL
jgi:hypothetical protein